MKTLLKKTEIALQYGNRPLKFDKTPILTGYEGESHFSAYDGVILTFNGFLREEIPDGVRGPALGVIDHLAKEYAIRHVIIRYFLEDDTVSICEVPILNSDLQGGFLLKRQKVLKKSGTDDNGAPFTDTFSIDDFEIGKELPIYGKAYNIVACDLFTENFAKKHLNRSFTPTGETLPSDPYAHAREVVMKHLATASQHKENSDAWLKEKYRRFVSDYGKVLRFYCVWDDTDNMYGDLKAYEIHYYLVDDSVEIRHHGKNSTHDTQSLLVRRTMLPKKITGIYDLAGTTPLGTEVDAKVPKPEMFYSWRDIKVGSVVNVLGRKFIIYDIDGYTRDFYKQHGFSDTELKPIQSPIERFEEEHKRVVLDRSVCDDTFMFKKMPVRHINIFKILQNNGKTMCFRAQLITDRSDDQDRSFVLTFKLADEVVAVFEPAGRAEGTVGGGKIAERALVVNPETGEFYTAADFFVGAEIAIYGRTYLLTEADEFAYNWMQEHASEFPYGDLKLINSKLASSRNSIKTKIATGFGSKETCSLENFKQALLEATSTINAHEAITLSRQYAADSKHQTVNVQKFLQEF